MIEEFGDIWKMHGSARVITTNGVVRKDGACVMGRGVALQAKERYPGIEFALGEIIRIKGNHVFTLMSEEGDTFFSFPVKHHWRDRADLDLIRRSAEEIMEAKFGRERILMPRPGCGNGGLTWEEVKPVIAPILDDDFVVIAYQSN
jgi:hypothetical protein